MDVKQVEASLQSFVGFKYRVQLEENAMSLVFQLFRV